MGNKNYFEGFEGQVKAMTAKEIILSMVDGIKNPVMTVDINDYGSISEDGICYGCAATNTICKLANVDPGEVLPKSWEISGLSIHGDFLSEFEEAIDHLRVCNFYSYNRIAFRKGFAMIINFHGFNYKVSQQNFSSLVLHSKWIELANKQVSVNGMYKRK